METRNAIFPKPTPAAVEAASVSVVNLPAVTAESCEHRCQRATARPGRRGSR